VRANFTAGFVTRVGAKNDTVNGGTGTDQCVTDLQEVSTTSCP
jgi:hypothetical protein